METLFTHAPELYIKAFLVSLLSWLMVTLIKMNSEYKQAIKIGVDFSFGMYLKHEVLAIAANIVALLLTILFVDGIYDTTKKSELITLILVGTVSSSGAAGINFFFGGFGKALKATLVKRSLILDEEQQTENKPTPLEKP
jgi:hypothetical protein